MTAFDIRLATLEDAAELGGFLKALNHFHRLEGQTLEEVQSQVARELRLCLAGGSHSVYLATGPGGEIAGYANVHWLPYLFLPGPEGYVSELFVAEAARGQGIGSALLDAVQDEARRRGCARLSLLNMRGRESYARGFYAKAGWTERDDAANFVLDFREPYFGLGRRPARAFACVV